MRVFTVYVYIDHEPSPDIIAQLAQETYKADLLQLLILNIQKFEFEVIIKSKKKGELNLQFCL